MAHKFKIPESKVQADLFIRSIGRLYKKGDKLKDELNQEISDLKREAEQRLSEIEAEITHELAVLYGFFMENKKELTQDGKISVVVLPSGEMEIFLTKPAVNVRKEKQVIINLRGSGLGRLVRIREEVNRDAVLLEPEAVADIKGINVVRKEKFLVKPNTTLQSITEYTKKLKKLLK